MISAVAVSLLMTVVCGMTRDVEAGLVVTGEVLVGEGITMIDEPFRIYTNPKTGAFTVVVRKANGLSCLLVIGSDYRQLKGSRNETHH